MTTPKRPGAAPRAVKAVAPTAARARKPAVRAGSRADDPFAAPAQTDVLNALLLGTAAVPLRAGRKAALKDRVLARAAAETPARQPGIVTVPASDEGWFEALPKIRIKQVYTDGTAESYLVRLEPGARAPAHEHPGDEECVVLEGSVRYIGGSTLKAGDYEAVFAGAQHSELVSDTGALVYLRYSQPLAGYLKL